MPVLQREWGDTEAANSTEIEDVTDVLHESQILNAKHNDVSAAHSYKTKLKIEAQKKEDERKKKHMQTIHNTVSKNILSSHVAVAGYSVKLANERVSKTSEQSELTK